MGRSLRRWVGQRLHRRLFVWFGASIAMTAASVAIVTVLATPPDAHWSQDWVRFRHFVGNQYARVWHDPIERAEMARQTASELAVEIVLRDAQGRELHSFGDVPCTRPRFQAPVEGERGELLGQVEICADRQQPRLPWLLLSIAAACMTLWAASGIIARRLGRPLAEVADVARAIGDGRLESRVRLRRAGGELATLAEAINDMAARIEKQLRDQRELLAAVSHEIRTPLGHIRILLETAREAGERGEPLSACAIDELEQEVLEIDDLVSELLASSRLSFESLEQRSLEALDLGVRALERAGLTLDKLDSDAESLPLRGDATLLSRALANLLENAKRHGGGVARLVIEADGDAIVFAVDDRGPGIDPRQLERIFDSFYRGDRCAGAHAGSLGLGLSLVRRIAEAHGGRAWAENRPDGGARVAFRVAAAGPPPRPSRAGAVTSDA